MEIKKERKRTLYIEMSIIHLEKKYCGGLKRNDPIGRGHIRRYVFYVFFSLCRYDLFEEVCHCFGELWSLLCSRYAQCDIYTTFYFLRIKIYISQLLPQHHFWPKVTMWYRDNRLNLSKCKPPQLKVFPS